MSGSAAFRRALGCRVFRRMRCHAAYGSPSWRQLRSRVTAESVLSRNLDQDDPDAVGVLDLHLAQAPGLCCWLPDNRTPAAASRACSAWTSRIWIQIISECMRRLRSKSLGRSRSSCSGRPRHYSSITLSDAGRLRRTSAVPPIWRRSTATALTRRPAQIWSSGAARPRRPGLRLVLAPGTLVLR
jgi:hypothetical protein